MALRATLGRVIAVVTVLGLGACSASPSAGGPPRDTAPPAATEQRSAVMFSSPDCACCHVYAQLLIEAGWNLETVMEAEMTSFKQTHGIPSAVWSCHTMLVDGYFVEGHVPFPAIERLLRERPAVDGIALPGMPPGSPGMGGDQVEPFEVVTFTSGVIEPFGSY